MYIAIYTFQRSTWSEILTRHCAEQQCYAPSSRYLQHVYAGHDDLLPRILFAQIGDCPLMRLTQPCMQRITCAASHSFWLQFIMTRTRP